MANVQVQRALKATNRVYCRVADQRTLALIGMMSDVGARRRAWLLC